VCYISRVGVFATLTNAYALVAVGASENFYRFVSSFSEGGGFDARLELNVTEFGVGDVEKADAEDGS
jgi:translation initiation factor 6 (eIF-6)